MNLRYFVLSLFIVFSPLYHKSISFDSRIVGGSIINITRVPFVLSLRLNDIHICGATIISTKWGLTAAHCVIASKTKKELYSVRSGSSFYDKGGNIANITKIIAHELFDDYNNDYDIAVFEIKQSFERSKTTRAIDLPGNNYVNDKRAIVVGWGYYAKQENILSKNLRYAVVPKVDRFECANDYESLYDLTARQVCYGYQEGGKDSCKGDSGGPLVASPNVIIGITSWGNDCGEARSPGVYTTIFLMLDWIYDKTGVKSRL